ncbi:uncharacterized protein LOC106468189 [Limulus polyphemus]|uniref:NADH dehydrogenase [ubiquinone] 1 beta subcomplex subunit 4 n=1 Tax=Limulus polyphemus TaxID=6850 RepID=A0ABM1BKX6_LIMPO|nr:uncharacterized protein LOC106468189 [Limulus polyphemus]
MGDGQVDASFEEKRAVAERAKLRAALKKEYIKQLTDPHRHASGEGGYLFDSGVQRFMSMRATMYDHFRPTLKGGIMWFSFVLFPIIGYGYFLNKKRREFDEKCRRGEIAYKDRLFKFI